MMAAIQCAKSGYEVTLFEKNEKLGKKLFITGKGRCNITNACDVSDLFSQVVSNAKFLYSAFYGFTNEDTISFFENLGLRVKVERGMRVFPQSDKSSDVIRVLQKECQNQKVVVQLNTRVTEIVAEEGKVRGVALAGGRFAEADRVILATGGVSYPSTGSTGEGHAMAEKLGHSVQALRPGLVGMTVKEDYPERLQGLTLKNVSVAITDKGVDEKNSAKKAQKESLSRAEASRAGVSQSHAGKAKFQELGELLFTHYGVSGPLILSASSLLGDRIGERELALHIDLKPALSREQLEKRVLRDFEERKNADIHNALGALLPKSMIPVMLAYAGIFPERKVHEVTREERGRLLDGMKDFTLTLTGLRGMDEAIITRGGVSVKEVDPATMESKLVKGLYFAGEILDLDALTGGFNLQIAWSTGYAAGRAE